MEKQSRQEVELDALDRRILRVLQGRADISQAELAEKVAASPASCWRRVVAKHDQVMECLSMSGEWDYLLRVVVGDVRDYEAFLMGELLAHPGVANTASHFALKRVKYTTSMPV
jgi:Lrp/AsnC family transcriptional regulator